MAGLVAGAQFGTALLWILLVGALLKWALNEGLARWQLGTDTTLLEGWCRNLPWPFHAYLVPYLAVWTFVVAGGLMAACGMAARALTGVLTVPAWGLVHGVVAAALVLIGRYAIFERIMQALIGLMVVTLVGSVVLLRPDLGTVLTGLVPRLPSGSTAAALSLMGGVGGSVTLLAYGYWIRERGWTGPDRVATIRLDLGVGYAATALFGAAMLILSATVLGAETAGSLPGGSAGLVACGDAIGEAAALRLGEMWGPALRVVFLVGVWAAVSTSTLGVWQGVPYLLSDYLLTLRGSDATPSPTSPLYRRFLVALTSLPALLLLVDRPVWVVLLYTVTGSLFMPVLAATLLGLATRRHLGPIGNRWWHLALLWTALALFAALTLRQLSDLF
jgi:Mn2+/Fe2+ NRAMP family transporter